MTVKHVNVIQRLNHNANESDGGKDASIER